MITALANNSRQVQRFVIEANSTATATATQDGNLRATLADAARAARAAASDDGQARDRPSTTNTPVLENLNAASGEIDRLFTDLPAFSHSAMPGDQVARSGLGDRQGRGRRRRMPTVTDLNEFAKPTPELAQNLAIVLADLDTQSRAVERDPRSPGGKGFSGLQALLGYVFNQALAINTYGPFGHVLAVDAFYSDDVLAVRDAGDRRDGAPSLRLASTAQCYSWLGPNQPGSTRPTRSDPSAPCRTRAARLRASRARRPRAAARLDRRQQVDRAAGRRERHSVARARAGPAPSRGRGVDQPAPDPQGVRQPTGARIVAHRPGPATPQLPARAMTSTAPTPPQLHLAVPTAGAGRQQSALANPVLSAR